MTMFTVRRKHENGFNENGASQPVRKQARP